MTDDTPRPRGRPRRTDATQALDAAMRVFWAAGYDGASMDRLCRETGMSRASLYSDYGDKAGLFMAAIAHYVDTQIAPVTGALGPKGTLPADLAAFFDAVVDLATRDGRTPGCLISCVLADVAGSDDGFRQELDRRFAALENRIAQRLSQDDTMVAADIPAMAGMLAAVARGIMLRARSGAAAEALRPVGSVAVRVAEIARG